MNFDIINANNLSIDIFTEHKKVNEQIEYRLTIKNTSEKLNVELIPKHKSEFFIGVFVSFFA